MTKEEPHPTESPVPRDTILPPQTRTKGRGQGSGEWLEWELKNAFDRWGYSTEIRQDVYGLEVDLVARRPRPRNAPSDWVLAQCKDWKDRSITPTVIYRLCMLAFTCKAVPVLCTTTDLTHQAATVANHWEVRVLSYPDLQRGSLPGPQVVSFRGRKYEPAASDHLQSMRHRRGRIPPMFADHPVTELSYVPGYKPTGRYGEYEPTTISRE